MNYYDETGAWRRPWWFWQARFAMSQGASLREAFGAYRDYRAWLKSEGLRYRG